MSHTVQRVRDFGTLSPNWEVFVKLLPSRLRDPYWRGDRKTVRARSDAWLPGDSVFQTQQNWRPWECIQAVAACTGASTGSSRGIPALEGEKEHGIPSPKTKKLFPVNIPSSMGSHWVQSPCFLSGPMPRNRWTYKMNSIIIVRIFCFTLFLHIFYFKGSRIKFFWDISLRIMSPFACILTQTLWRIKELRLLTWTPVKRCGKT